MSGNVYEVYKAESRDDRPEGPFVLTCEHASNDVPAPLTVSESDRAWLTTHWGWDIGASEVTRELVRRTDSVGVFANFTRLVCDPNRGPDDPTWIRTEIEGQPLGFNQDLTNGERSRRARELYDPYHHAVDRVLGERLATGTPEGVMLLAVHSFTPVFDGAPRSMEVGVLYDIYEEAAQKLAAALTEQGFVTALNEPYSGHDGVISSAARHGQQHDVLYLELEIRQDLITDEARAIEIAHRIQGALDVFGL